MKSATFFLTRRSSRICKEIMKDAFEKKNIQGVSSTARKTTMNFQGGSETHCKTVLPKGTSIQFMSAGGSYYKSNLRNPNACWIKIKGLLWTVQIMEDGKVAIKHAVIYEKPLPLIERRQTAIAGMKLA